MLFSDRSLWTMLHGLVLSGGALSRGRSRLAEDLKVHAQSEEEVFYPGAILVGDLVRMHLHPGCASH